MSSVFAVFLLGMAGNPLTTGLIGKWAACCRGGVSHPGRRRDRLRRDRP